MRAHYFFRCLMKKILIIGLLCLGLFVVSAAGQSVVMLDGSLGEYNLVYSSSDPVEVSAFQVLLRCDSNVAITNVEAGLPYEVFYGVPDENGYVTIAGYTTVLPGNNQNTPFAKIFTTGPGSIRVVGVEMEDFNRQKIVLENAEIYTDATQTGTPIPTAVSTTPTQVVTQPTAVPTSEQTQNVEPLQTSTPVPTGQVPLSTKSATPSPTQTPFPTVLVVLDLAGVIFMLRRAND